MEHISARSLAIRSPYGSLIDLAWTAGHRLFRLRGYGGTSMLERYSLYVIAAGALLGFAGYVWLVVRAFHYRRWWGVALIVLPPAALIFIGFHFRRAVAPICLLLLSALMIGAPYAANYYESHF